MPTVDLQRKQRPLARSYKYSVTHETSFNDERLADQNGVFVDIPNASSVVRRGIYGGL